MLLLRDTGWVAAYELGEALRTRLFQLVLIAYLGAIGAATWLLTKILSEMEAPIAAAMHLPPTDRPGALLNQLLADGRIVDLLRPIVGSESAARALSDTPVAALWGGAAAMIFLPIVLLFTSAGSVATEVKSRSIRYLAVRTGRLPIGLGKLVGQLALGAVAATAGVALSWAMSMTLMVGNDPVKLFVGLSVHTGWALAYALPFVGLGLATSQLIPNPNAARVLAGMIFAAMPPLNWWLTHKVDPGLGARIADLATMFIASSAWKDLWSPDLTTAGMAAARGAALAVIYYAVGHARFAQRDL